MVIAKENMSLHIFLHIEAIYDFEPKHLKGHSAPCVSHITFFDQALSGTRSFGAPRQLPNGAPRQSSEVLLKEKILRSDFIQKRNPYS